MSSVPVSTARHRGNQQRKVHIKEGKGGDHGGINDVRELTFALQQAKEEALASVMSVRLPLCLLIKCIIILGDQLCISLKFNQTTVWSTLSRSVICLV